MADLHISIPASYEAERRYAAEVMLCEFLGLDVDIEVGPLQNVRITCPSSTGTIVVVDDLFGLPADQWLTTSCLPDAVSSYWSCDTHPTNIPHDSVPLFRFNKHSAREPADAGAHETVLPFDPFGHAFFFLTRLDEAVTPTRDQFGRHPASASTAGRLGLLSRPLVNEYLEILWAYLKQSWPGLERCPRHFRLIASHDVDIPFLHAFTSPARLLLSCGADVIRRKSVAAAFRRVHAWTKTRLGDTSADPANTFSWIMDASERQGIRSDFYFLVARTNRSKDGNYEISHPLIEALLEEIVVREHGIGLHTSYETYRSDAQVKHEVGVFRRLCEKLGVGHDFLKSRQHWLRWETPTTPAILSANGVCEDSTLAYTEHAGFRCGTCYDYPFFDLVQRRRLDLRERPLLVMDASITEPHTMNLGLGAAALDYIRSIKNECRNYSGDFTLLWHNSSLESVDQRRLYLAALNA